jgi:hypothetical protein
MILSTEEVEHRKTMRFMGYAPISLIDEKGKEYRFEYVQRHKLICSELFILVEEVKCQV